MLIKWATKAYYNLNPKNKTAKKLVCSTAVRSSIFILKKEKLIKERESLFILSPPLIANKTYNCKRCKN